MVQWPRLPPLPGAPLPAPRKLCGTWRDSASSGGAQPWEFRGLRTLPLGKRLLLKKKKKILSCGDGEKEIALQFMVRVLCFLCRPLARPTMRVEPALRPLPCRGLSRARRRVLSHGAVPRSNLHPRIKDPLNGLVPLAFMWQWPIIDETDVTYNLLL